MRMVRTRTAKYICNRYSKDTNGQPKLENIESDEEYEIASDAFDELLDSMEYDELVSEDELN